MSKNTKIIISVLIALAIVVAGLLAWKYVTPKTVTNEEAVNISQIETESETVASDNIVYTDDGKQVEYVGQNDTTALDLLKSLTDVETKDSQFGSMVVGIHDVQAEDGKTYWAFYVNGAYANEGAGTFVTKDTDKLMWKLEEIE